MFQARLYDAIGLIRERNQVSAEFKKFDEQEPTHAASVLTTML